MVRCVLLVCFGHLWRLRKRGFLWSWRQGFPCTRTWREVEGVERKSASRHVHGRCGTMSLLCLDLGSVVCSKGILPVAESRPGVESSVPEV